MGFSCLLCLENGSVADDGILQRSAGNRGGITVQVTEEVEGKLAVAARSYISTFIGQFIDNLVFSIIVFTIFAPIFWDGFHWTLLQCVSCALTGALAELIMEVAFSPIGYRIVTKWTEQGVGQAYLDYVKERKQS